MASLAVLLAFSAHAGPMDLEADGVSAGPEWPEIEHPVGPGLGRDDLVGVAVVNGQTVDEEMGEVVALGFEDPNTGRVEVFCTGSLIHARWVLTAAHCIVPASQGPPGWTQVVMWGNTQFAPIETIPWAQGIRDTRYSESSFDVTYDAGLIELAEPKQNPELMVLNDQPVDASWIGVELTFFGYGVTADQLSDSGVLRTTTIPIDEVLLTDVSTFQSGTNVCFGDSGGPSTYLNPDGLPEQVGISSTVDPGCVGGGAESARVDVHMDWILGFVPEVITDHSQLAPPDIDDEGVGPGRAWNDLGADDANGAAGWSGRDPVVTGCTNAAGTIAWWAVLLTGWLVQGRRRRR